MLVNDLRPDGPHVFHQVPEIEVHRTSRFNSEKLGNPWPEMAPTKNVAVVYIERLVGTSFMCRDPDCRFGKNILLVAPPLKILLRTSQRILQTLLQLKREPNIFIKS